MIESLLVTVVAVLWAIPRFSLMSTNHRSAGVHTVVFHLYVPSVNLEWFSEYKANNCQAHEHHRKHLESLPSTSYPLGPTNDPAEVEESQQVTDGVLEQR